MPEALFLIPGLLCDAAVWQDQIVALERVYDIYVPDLGGCNTIQAMADLVLSEAPDVFSLAGHSMGARVALEIVARSPERISRLALLDTGLHPPRPGEAEKRQVLLDVSAGQGMHALADRWLPQMVGAGALDTNPELRAALYAMVERMTPQIHRNQITALLHRPDARAALPKIVCPLLVGVGRHDRWSPPSQHEEIVAAVPGATYVIFENSGHMAPMEVPQAVTEALAAWMQTSIAIAVK